MNEENQIWETKKKNWKSEKNNNDPNEQTNKQKKK